MLRTPANAIALVALMLAVTSSAAAAILISGANVKNGTLTGADVANGTLQLADFSAAARTKMRGATGSKGATGVTGDKGATGPDGVQGLKGTPARVASKWSWFDSRYLRTDGTNSGPNDWNAYNGTNALDYNVQPTRFGLVNGLNRSYETVMDLNSPNCNEGDTQGVECAWGENGGGGVTVAWNSNITAVASISVYHSQDADIAVEGPVHTRVQCYLSANRGTGSSDYDQIGAKTSTSGFRQRQVETITLVGSINRTASASTDYMVRVECRDADGTEGRTRYYVVGGSMSVIATERG